MIADLVPFQHHPPDCDATLTYADLLSQDEEGGDGMMPGERVEQSRGVFRGTIVKGQRYIQRRLAAAMSSNSVARILRGRARTHVDDRSIGE